MHKRFQDGPTWLKGKTVARMKCRECGNEVSTKAKLCPKCGVRGKKAHGMQHIDPGYFLRRYEEKHAVRNLLNGLLIRQTLLSFLISIFLVGIAPAVNADILITNHGLKLDGELLDIKGEYVRFKDNTGRVMKYPKSEVSSITTDSGVISESELAEKKAEKPAHVKPEKDSELPFSIEIASGEFEEVVLKNGHTVYGLIENIGTEEIEITAVIGKSSVTKALIPLGQVATIRKIDEEKRTDIARNINWIKRSKPGRQSKKIIQGIERVRDAELGECWEVVTPHFHILGESTRSFMKAIAYKLEQMFEGYHIYLDAPSEESPLIEIRIFPSKNRYDRFVRKLGDVSLLKAAGFYSSSAGIVVTHHEYETFAVDVIELQRNIDTYEKQMIKIAEENQKIDDNHYDAQTKMRWKFADARDEIERRAIEMEDALNDISPSLSAVELDRRHQAIFQWKDGEIARIYRNEEEYERKATILEEENSRVQEENEEFNLLLAKMEDITRSILSRFKKDQLQVLYHEIWHAYADNVICGAEGKDKLPLWLNEGMAEFFENSQIDLANTLISKPDKRHLVTLRSAGSKGLIPLENLFSISPQEAYGKNADLFYAESWCLAYYLDKTYDLRRDKLMLRYIEDFHQTGDAAGSFEKVFQVKLGDLERDFKASIFRQDF